MEFIKKNLKLIIFLSIQFSIVLTICLIILFEGKKNYTVTFDLNGGTYVSGELVQTVRYGQAATAPKVTREGHALVSWSVPFNVVKEDIVVYAVWDYQTSYGIEFEIIGNYCLVSDCFDNLSGDVYISAFYSGKKVLGIKDEAFKDCKNITGIYLQDGMLSLGNNAFSGCSSLERIIIPSTVETIGTNVLTGCNQLKELTIPFVGNSIFKNTSPYFGYLFGGTSYLDAYLKVPRTLHKVSLTTDYVISDFAFFNCSRINNINVVGAIEEIGANAFRNCKKLVEITLPNSVKNIGEGAFVNCSSLTTITLPSMLECLQDAVFANCTKLENVTINKSLTEIASNAFQNCTKLSKFEINNNSNFVFENDKLYILKENDKLEYVITLEKYVDEVNDFVELRPPFIILPDKYPFIPGIDEDDVITEEGNFEKEPLFPRK